jgi:hypothetical protein
MHAAVRISMASLGSMSAMIARGTAPSIDYALSPANHRARLGGDRCASRHGHRVPGEKSCSTARVAEELDGEVVGAGQVRFGFAGKGL